MTVEVPALDGTGEELMVPEPDLEPVAPAVEAAAEDAALTLADSLAPAYEAAFIGSPEAAKDAIVEEMKEVELTPDGQASLVDLEQQIVHDAGLAEATDGLTIDEVNVEVVGAPEITASDGQTVSATVEVMITRHIAEDDVDWVEVIPHEVIVDAVDGQVQEIVVHDLEEQMLAAQAEAEERVPSDRLMVIPEETTAVAPIALSATNRQNVANYAVKWATGYNPSYVRWEGSDCTNFVSQAMYAGGWKEVAHPVVDYKWDNAWWYGGIPTASWTWTGAENFYRMTKALGRTTIAKYVTDLRVGDLLQYKAKGSSTMTHSMVVTKKSGSTVYLSYHTSNTLNKPFSQMSGMAVTWYGHHV